MTDLSPFVFVTQKTIKDGIEIFKLDSIPILLLFPKFKKLVAMSSNESTRLYISNLNFSSTEPELYDYFKDYDVKSVLIPSQTVRGFRSNQVRPLGIAYAEFESFEMVKDVIDNLNGKEFKGRELRLKTYVPYSPTVATKKLNKTNYLSRLRRRKNQEHSEESELISNVEVVQREQEEEEKIVEEPELSEDTVYCGYLPKGVTDVDIRHYFQEYNPQEIWIFRTKLTKSRHFQLHRHFTAALVSFEKGTSSQEISEAVSDKKLLNKKIVVKPAYLAKIEELKQISKEKISIEQGNTEQQSQQSQPTNE